MTYAEEMRLLVIEDELKKAESNKKTAVALMVISIFFLWPLLFIGAFMHDKATKEIEKLNEEKRAIMFSECFNKNN